MRLETSGDNPFTTSAVCEAWSGLSLIQFGRASPANSRLAYRWAHHALEAKGRNWHVFRIYASHGTSLVNRPRYGGQYDDSNLDCVVYSRTVDGTRYIICQSYRFELTTSFNFEKPNANVRSSNNSCQWMNSTLYLTCS